MSKRRDGIVIAGGGLAAQRCAEALRRCGYGGRIWMVCAERRRPYDRPPLSKELLAGARSDDSVTYRPAEWYEREAIDLLLGVHATSLDCAERRVGLSDATSLAFDELLIATGSRPKTLPSLEAYENVSTLRTIDDCERLRTALARRPRLVVIGAGFIGLEVAATARCLGAEVTIIEAAPSPLAGVLGSQLGGWFGQLHRSEGVEVLTSSAVRRVIGNGALTGLQLSTGRTVRVDHVVIGIGVAPEVGWLAGSGLHTAGGVRVDANGRTSADHVFAAGDAAATFDPALGCHVPGSHWEAAGRLGVRAARVMLATDPGGASPSSFWTDQYGIRIQYLGQARAGDSVQIDGEPAARSFTATFTRDRRVVAVLLVGRSRLLPAARKLIQKGRT
jgi:NADPH-dependent 2,4-dienoyl-CoA reductase/sulfur reductase-like enzyme